VTPELRIEGLSKRFAPPATLLRPLLRVADLEVHDALRDVSFSVGQGEIVGLVGPNGAGKTTLVKIVATLLEATSGDAVVGPYSVATHPREARARLGLVLSDDRGLYWRLTARQNLEFFGVMAGLSRSAARARTSDVLRLVDLADDGRLAFGFSSGMRMRLSLGRALLADPPLLVLDEPTRSLDPIAGERLWTQLRELAGAGRAVLACSHDLDAVASWCDRAVVLVAGQVRHVGPVDELAAREHGPVRALASLLMHDSAQ